VESSQRLAIFENLLLKQCILNTSQLSLKTWNNISIEGGGPPGYALVQYALLPEKKNIKYVLKQTS